jgi:hypothetical protein
MVTPSAEITWPKYATLRSPNAHLDRFTNSWCTYSLARTSRRCVRCSAQEEL